MKLKNLSVVDVIKDPRIIMALWNHLNYSINQVTKYDDLTVEEQKIIPKALWEHIIEEGEPLYLYQQTEIEKVAEEILELAQTSTESMNITRNLINNLYNTQTNLESYQDIQIWINNKVQNKALEDLYHLQEQIRLELAYIIIEEEL